jgi:hypothetical protein
MTWIRQRLWLSKSKCWVRDQTEAVVVEEGGLVFKGKSSLTETSNLKDVLIH